ncbi:MAG: hypothetical protein J0L57_21855 [Burkholderiales bacterium]|nr:hypothetical protein [Burkholderiales bacterium]
MNASSASEQGVLGLVEIVELKWLLSGEGMHVHVERLQSDPDYACQCLEAAERSANPALRQVALRLRTRLRCAPHG